MPSFLDALIHRALRHHGLFQAGAGPFITFRSYQLAGRRIIWQAREHRKGLLRMARAVERLPVPLWRTRAYNQLMGGTFAVGSALFMVGSGLSMLPQPSMLLLAWANMIFFLGSIPFTLAAYMQHFQAANTSDFSCDPAAEQGHRARMHWLGWKPKEAGWLSTLTQFLGTLAFNISTLSAVQASQLWYVQDWLAWGPDMLGSVLFLVSAYLAFVEANHAFWRWQPGNMAWQIVFVNLLGCVAFMVAACTAFAPPQGQAPALALFSNIQLMLGAVCFLAGALLAIRESREADRA